MLRQTYEAFKDLLAYDIRSHELMAEFMELYHDARLEDFARTRDRYRQLEITVSGMVSAFEKMNPLQAGSLRQYLIKYDFYIHLIIAPPERFLIPPLVVGHDRVADADLVGQKSHTLLRMKNELLAPVPEGFTITATAAFLLIEQNRLRERLDTLLAGIDLHSAAVLEETSAEMMRLVRGMDVPEPLRRSILDEYDRIAASCPGGEPPVAVRSSALHEDGEYSFAGQYETVLAVSRPGLLDAYLEVLASKYTPEALLYRVSTGLSDEEAAMAVLVLVMIDAAASGVVYTRNPVAESEGEELLIQSVHGLGQPLVSGQAEPDAYLFAGKEQIPGKISAGSQSSQLILENGQLLHRELPAEDGGPLSLRPEQASRLAALARETAAFFGGPQDIEWALDSEGQLYLLQSRPLRTEQPKGTEPENAEASPDITPLLLGAKRASGGCGCGRVHHLDPEIPALIPDQAVLVTRSIPPSLVRYIGGLAAVVCAGGAITGHFATICREMGVPLLVDVGEAHLQLPSGALVTVDANRGAVYPGRIDALLARSPVTADRQATPHFRRLRAMLDHITPLHLIDPGSPEFRVQSCRSLHDIIRFIHEKSVQTMFGLGDMVSGKSRRSRKLETDLPLDIYLLDVGGAFLSDDGDTKTISIDDLDARPFKAIWEGLCHPDIDWDSRLHFDWKAFGDMALSGGLASGGAGEFASYAVVSPDYLNLNMRFGFHFTLVDCFCGEESRANYCQVRFAGGGGDYQGRSMRIRLLRSLFSRLGFEVRVRADLLDARVADLPAPAMNELLVMVGRLLGTTKLLDMVLKEDEDITRHEERFFADAPCTQGAHHPFSPH